MNQEDDNWGILKWNWIPTLKWKISCNFKMWSCEKSGSQWAFYSDFDTNLTVFFFFREIGFKFFNFALPKAVTEYCKCGCKIEL